jgi:hypothetical protein
VSGESPAIRQAEASQAEAHPDGAPRSLRAVDDPVRARRQQVARWSLLANRVGYLCYGLAIAVFIIGFAVGFTPAVVTIVVAALIVGSALLLPSIILGYAVKAAEREDRERGV